MSFSPCGSLDVGGIIRAHIGRDLPINGVAGMRLTVARLGPLPRATFCLKPQLPDNRKQTIRLRRCLLDAGGRFYRYRWPLLVA